MGWQKYLPITEVKENLVMLVLRWVTTWEYMMSQAKLVHFKQGKLGLALSKQQILEGLLKSGFSPTIQASTILYEMIESFPYWNKTFLTI